MNWFRTIDWALLRQQKQTLLKTVEGATAMGWPTEHLDGIVHLIDAMQDEAVRSGAMSSAAVFGGMK